ncbi:MAG: hypothetical protein OEZ03_06490 [Alphaproteobacteria bacterium]|nr:hypothetical protein [Alphaproteobacteria bacterium]
MPHTNIDDSAPGIEMIRAEMRQQHVDAVASLNAAARLAGRVAAPIRRTGRLVPIGMGGSHCINRTAEALYRAQGIDTIAITASEQLYQPLSGLEDCTRILVSQSGEPAEIVRMLNKGDGGGEGFGITLDGNSRLGRSLPCLVDLPAPDVMAGLPPACDLGQEDNR